MSSHAPLSAARPDAAPARIARVPHNELVRRVCRSLTLEKVTQLKAELAGKEAELQKLLATSPKQLWEADLDAFIVGYEQWEAELAAAEAGVPKVKAGGKGKAAAKKKKAADSDDDDDFMDDDDSDWEQSSKKKKAAAKAKAAKEKAAAPPPPPSLANAVPIAVPVQPLKRKAPAKESSSYLDDDSESNATSSRPASRLASPHLQAFLAPVGYDACEAMPHMFLPCTMRT